METNSLGGLIHSLDTHLDNESELLRLLDNFNKSNEMRFRFENGAAVLHALDERQKSVFHSILAASWSYLGAKFSDQNEKENVQRYVRVVSSCLNSIRIISRDSETIKLFENPSLLEIIQVIGNLNFHDEKISASGAEEKLSVWTAEPTSHLRLHALKAMSNLIYNSKFVQDFYMTNGVAEMITIYLKQFSPSEVLSEASASTKLELSVVMFNLRVLFLLTVFNRELRLKLREKLQVVTYLIEIIDQVMKERLNGGSTSSSFDGSGVASPPGDDLTPGDMLAPADYCLLKPVDVDFIIEILKILYNLTMDMAPHSKLNTSGTSGQLSVASNNEEEEAHLMHLVSVLRDLITCRLELPAESNQDPIASCNNPKLMDLQSNIINLLTNMPSTCYEELMSPLNPLPSSASSQPTTSYYLNVRMAHNRKRISRRSKRMKQKQQQQDEPVNKPPIDDIGFDDQDVEFEGKNMEAVTIILSFMNRHVNTYMASSSGSNADALCPVLLLLSLMSKSNKLIREYCRLKVLPPLKRADLLRLPQQGNHLRNKLVRLMTDANLQLKRLSAQFLFVLCKESTKKLIKYTGFGNAAGLLAEMGLMLSKQGGDTSAYSSSDSADDQCSDSDDYKQLEPFINPVTGRAEPGPAVDPFEGMTDEQKEYEAMRLVSDLDRLARISGGIKPARVGPDGRPVAIEHVLELQESIKSPASNPDAKH